VRRAAGRNHELQPMAANVDTMFLVTSCNDEFNRSRVERYLALALEAGVRPVVVLTKGDLAESAIGYRQAAAELMRDLPVEVVDARDPATLGGVRAWCGTGQTVALLGSSGVGKSTLVNSLAGADLQATGAIRAADAKGGTRRPTDRCTCCPTAACWSTAPACAN
jgi:ribosome biogenesis GTPase / thiamine phosphate phosphatase